jgi:hypothetical protein
MLASVLAVVPLSATAIGAGGPPLTGSISGTVTDTAAAPIAGICVYAYGPGFGSGQTSAAGAYQIADLAAGSYTVEFSDCANGRYISQFYRNASFGQQPTPVAVTGGSDTAHIDADMVLGGGISGTVRDDQGRPLAQACVDAEEAGGVGFGGFARTGLSGTYKILGLSPGQYRARFDDCGGGALAVEWYKGKSTALDADLVSVASGHTTKDINAAMVSGGSITGTVVQMNQPGGQPGICVDATDGAGSPANFMTTTTDRWGTYQIAHLYPGSYKVHFQDCRPPVAGGDRLADQWYNNKVSATWADTIQVVSGQATPAINATLQPQGVIAGTVTLAGQRPADRVCVSASPSAGPPQPFPPETQTTVSGSYRLSLPRGSYRIEFGYCDSPVALGLSADHQWYPNAPDPVGATPVSVSDGVTTSGVDANLPLDVSYYLSLGDSVGMWNGVDSYPFLVTSHERSHVPGLRVVDQSCSGETTASMLANSLCAPGGSQYLNALAFLQSHRGKIALVTIGIGGNDVVNCISAPDPTTCFLAGLKTIKKNLTLILAGLRAAAGPGVPIVGMNVYNPLLGDWLAPGPSRQLALLAEAGVKVLNADFGKIFTRAGSPVANVKQAFRTGDLTDFVSSPWGLIPVAVDRACRWLDIVCRVGLPEGFGDDPNLEGAKVIAAAFETAIGALRPPAATAATG